MDKGGDEGEVVFLLADVVIRGGYMVIATTEVAHRDSVVCSSMLGV